MITPPHPLSLQPVLAVDELIANTPVIASTAVVVGYNWTLVQTAFGSGLVMTSEKGKLGAQTTPQTGTYGGRSLAELAMLARSENPYERAIGCAAINAGLNTHDRVGPENDGLEVPRGEIGRVVVIGRFPKLTEKLPNAVVLEQNPGPDDLAVDAAPDVIPGAAYLIITASAWSNGSLAGLLDLVDNAHITLVGPGTPLSPILQNHGVHRLAGFIATAPEKLHQTIAEGAGMRGFRRLGHNLVMD